MNSDIFNELINEYSMNEYKVFSMNETMIEIKLIFRLF